MKGENDKMSSGTEPKSPEVLQFWGEVITPREETDWRFMVWEMSWAAFLSFPLEKQGISQHRQKSYVS